MCGGTPAIALEIRTMSGLSPRVRGNHRNPSAIARLDGSIPACAGEPRRLLVWRHGKRVYPRVCGGTSSRKFRADNLQGLSPRVRGNRCLTGCAAIG